MNHDKTLASLVKKQTSLFNQDASEAEKVLVYHQIREWLEAHKGRE